MARMIPSVYTGDKKNAEYKIFKMFDNAKSDGADKWTVFYSKHINNHITQMEGEMDFLVLVPGSGVVALEVKGGIISVIDDILYRDKEKLDFTP